MVFCESTNIRFLWDKHFVSLSEDYCHTIVNDKVVQHMVLRDINDMIGAMGKDIQTYGLPDLDEQDDETGYYNREVREQYAFGVHEEDLRSVKNLNSEQLSGFEEIIDHVRNKKGRVFFVDGPGGTGKTYLYKALIATVHSEGLLAVATVASSIAASIMPGGHTAHSVFKIPIKLTDSSMCNFTKQSDIADLHKAALVIWDEVAMTKRQPVETLDRSLQDIMGCTQLFGGKVMLFGGDFRQVLPVVARGMRAQITDATLISLNQNMRAQSDPWFSEYLLRIENGTEKTIAGDYVCLPEDIFIQYKDEHY
jgi:hypothetical protein